MCSLIGIVRSRSMCLSKEQANSNDVDSPGRPFYFQSKKNLNILQFAIFLDREKIQRDSVEDPPRFIGYLDYQDLRDLRERKLVYRYRNSRQRRQPLPYNFWTRDPYVLFMLLAIAQNHCQFKQDYSLDESITVESSFHPE